MPKKGFKPEVLYYLSEKLPLSLKKHTFTCYTINSLPLPVTKYASFHALIVGNNQ